MSKYDFSKVYAGLKDFQRDTVEYAFQRMYLDDPPARRFLVADEVGLGKTLVARGLIARAIEHLDRQGVNRIDVVYICSNSNIARQNISRLNVTQRDDFAFASRITLLASQLRQLTKNPLNFVSFTPGTSFDLKSNIGQQDERKLLYWLLRWAWAVPGSKGPKRVFQGSVRDFSSWEQRLRDYRSNARIDPGVKEGFFNALDRHDERADLAGEPTLEERFFELSYEWAHDRRNRKWEAVHRRNRFVGELRALLARATIDALEPDLVILDEFQRFKHLLVGESEAAQLAHSMFDYGDEHTEARTLLLSATPYKMYTLTDESAEDDHYADFTQTVEFLLNGDGQGFRDALEDMRRALLNLNGSDASTLFAAKDRVERQLRSVMARTERLAVTPNRDGMLVHADGESPALVGRDLVEYVAMDRAAQKLNAAGTLEYWKSAAYFSNFWDDYQIGRKYRRALEQDPHVAADVQQILEESPGLISWDDHRRYQELDPGNARLRHLWDRTIDQDIWKLLWLPPSLPYYALSGPFASEAARTFTKRLVFSAWNVVPKTISALTSYEAERRMMASRRGARMENTREAREKITELLRFPKTLTGMTAFGVVYPSPMLARLADPLKIASELRAEGVEPTHQAVLARAEEQTMRRLRRHLPKDGPEDDRWYWAAGLVLDREVPDQWEWLRWRAPSAWTGSKREAGEGFLAHLDIARKAHREELDLGRPPENLGKVLALLAVAGPGNIALRALGRFTPSRRSPYTNHEMRDQAAVIAWGFRSLYNNPEVMNLIRGLIRSGPYWQKLLQYGTDGCLQAVLDEYLHVARGWHGILEINNEADLRPAAQGLAEIVSLRSIDLRAQDPLDPEAHHPMRCRFALPFGQYRSEEEQYLQRSGFVRGAFNSPFWPFVLSTTSIGQEGLDFHLYCHAVVHWNLPSNPVDLEQREGRVHRYLGHAVRKNLAVTYGEQALADAKDPWEAMIDAAVAERSSDVNDLVPYWVFEGQAKIERHVPSLPLSREEGRLAQLQKSLALYRMVFGQPRQEELIAWLEERRGPSDWAPRLNVDLAPR
jgi:hypothetical protein